MDRYLADHLLGHVPHCGLHVPEVLGTRDPSPLPVAATAPEANQLLPGQPRAELVEHGAAPLATIEAPSVDVPAVVEHAPIADQVPVGAEVAEGVVP
jgi:hypothetical protein